MFKLSAPSTKREERPKYLCIINATWIDPSSSSSKDGVFAVNVTTEQLNMIEVIAVATIEVMKSANLAVAPRHISIVKDDKVVCSWMAGQDFREEDLWDRIEAILGRNKSQDLRSRRILAH